jgi:hypothetical protein
MDNFFIVVFVLLLIAIILSKNKTDIIIASTILFGVYYFSNNTYTNFSTSLENSNCIENSNCSSERLPTLDRLSRSGDTDITIYSQLKKDRIRPSTESRYNKLKKYIEDEMVSSEKIQWWGNNDY